MARKLSFAVLAATAVIVGSMAMGLPAQASVTGSSVPATAAHTVASQAVPPIDARPCDTSQTPQQIRLVLAPGAVICYGGTVGTWDLGQLHVQSLVAGGYWGWLRCEDAAGGYQQFFAPGDFHAINDTCQTLAITPPGWN